MSIHIALVEDDDVIRENYTEILADEGFDVEAFCNRQEALTHMQNQMPDIAILDVGLHQDRDGGFKLCSDLRRLSSELPIIFMTSRDDESDRISGLRLGADDYITKDIGINYLMVRIEALFHRIEMLTANDVEIKSDNQNIISAGSLEIDRNRLTIAWKGKTLDLSLTQFWILAELVTNPGEVKHYDKLMRAAKICVEPNTITAHIKTIRNRFRSIDDQFDCIKTERGAGYRWVEM
ncbi:MAG: response regulator [Gammaproteobacteria bacterium]|nr:response regulator [Gammaproteobacteria bacterium]